MIRPIAKTVYTLVLCLLFGGAQAQIPSTLKLKAELKTGGSEKEPVIAHRLLESDTKLLVVSNKTVSTIDLVKGSVVETHPVELSEVSDSSQELPVLEGPRVVSPDGRWLFVSADSSHGQKKEPVQPAKIWDLKTGKQAAVLDSTTKPIRGGYWSSNGATLLTVGYSLKEPGWEISFWDGETFTYLKPLPVNNISWWHFSRDGSKFFFSQAPIKRMLLLIKVVGESGGPIQVWNTIVGGVEKTVPVTDGNSLSNTRAIAVSPNGKFVAYVAENPTSSGAERRLVVRDMDHEYNPQYELKAKYEVAPAPAVLESGATFSPDGAYFAFDGGKTLQIYETASGTKKFELRKDDLPSHWLDENKILLYDNGNNLEAFEVSTGKQLYKTKLIYTISETVKSETIGDQTYIGTPEISILDKTEIVPHPARKMFLTYSKQSVKLHDARSGAVLQTLVVPKMETSKGKRRPSSTPLVWKAGWANDGKTLYIINADRNAVSLWQFKN